MTTPIDPTRTDPTDPLPHEQFSSWESALERRILRPQQVAVLEAMVDDHQAKSLDEAASILDLQETIIHPPEHMWGS